MIWAWDYFTFAEVFKANVVNTRFVTKDVLRNISRVLDAITQVRIELNERVLVNSFFRDPFHNAAARGQVNSFDPNGYHPKGLAIDVKHFQKHSVDEVLSIVKRYFNGIIIYDWGFHLDLRDGFYFEDKRTK